MIAGESPAWITPEGVLKPNLERKGVPLNTGILGVKQSEESITSKATRLFSVGVLVTGMFLPGMGVSGVLLTLLTETQLNLAELKKRNFSYNWPVEDKVNNMVRNAVPVCHMVHIINGLPLSMIFNLNLI